MNWDDVFGEPDEPLQPKIIKDIPQGSDEWKAIRCGKITSYKISQIMAKGKGKVRDKYILDLITERITGKPLENTFKSKAMQKGNDDEPLAMEAYEDKTITEAEQVTFVFHPTIENAGASPDGLIDDDGGIEIKNPNLQTHLEYRLTKKVPSNYLWQIQWQMACTGRNWWDFVSFAKELPPHLRLLIIRVNRDEKMIAELEKEAKAMNAQINKLIQELGEQ